MRKKIYMVCPVRLCTPELRQKMDRYVGMLEDVLGYEVHYPPRDVDQTNDDGAIRICEAHFKAMLECDEVHLWFDESSLGCHFDAGMAVMLAHFRGVRLVEAHGLESRPHKSFANWLRSKLS